MSLYQQIKADRIAALKSHNKVAKTALTTLIGEIQNSLPSPTDEATDEEVIKKVKKFIDGIDDTIKARLKLTLSVEEELAEKAVYEVYMPKMMSEEELTVIIDKAYEDINNSADTTSNINIGTLMQYLIKNYNGKYDGSLASQLVRAKLNSLK